MIHFAFSVFFSPSLHPSRAKKPLLLVHLEDGECGKSRDLVMCMIIDLIVSACLFRLSKESPLNHAHDARKRKTKKCTYGCEGAVGLVAKFAQPVRRTLRDNSRDCRKYQGYRQYQ